jgi:hypothetical protein
MTNNPQGDTGPERVAARLQSRVTYQALKKKGLGERRPKMERAALHNVMVSSALKQIIKSRTGRFHGPWWLRS